MPTTTKTGLRLWLSKSATKNLYGSGLGYGRGLKETNELDGITALGWDVVVDNLSGSLWVHCVERHCESILLKVEVWLLTLTLNSGWNVVCRINLVEVDRKLYEEFVAFSLPLRGFSFRAMKVSRASVWFVWDNEPEDKLYHLHMNEPKTLYLGYCQNNTFLDSPLLVWCRLFFAFLFWRYFPVFLETSASTKADNFGWFDRTYHKSFSKYFSFSATAIVWLYIL